MLQELEDAHRHPAALQAHALALPLLLLVAALLVRARLRRGGPREVARPARGERALEVGEVRVVCVVGEGEAAERELDERDPERPDVGFDGVLRALDPLGLWGGMGVSDGM